jgi:hypothetical protein
VLDTRRSLNVWADVRASAGLSPDRDHTSAFWHYY